MVCGLFSSFDPSVEYQGSYYFVKWVVMISSFGLISWRVWSLSMSSELVGKMVVSFSTQVISQSTKSVSKMSVMGFGVFYVFLITNMCGLFPGAFTLSAHLVVNFSMSMGLWVAGVVVSISKSTDHFASHLLPSGSPVILWPLLVVVESVSLAIRPMTLAIRMMANIMAGHMIMGLVASFSANLEALVAMVPIIVESGFMVFELCVAVVQAYVFKSLLILYWAESCQYSKY